MTTPAFETPTDSQIKKFLQCPQINALEFMQNYLRRFGDNIIHARDKMNNTILHNAAELDTSDYLIPLLEAGADVAARNNAGATPLLHAAYAGNLANIGLLIAAGADVDATENDGWNAVMFSIVRDNIDSLALLKEEGAHIFTRNQKQESALDVAIHLKSPLSEAFIRAWQAEEHAKLELTLNEGTTHALTMPRGSLKLQKPRL